MGGEIRSGNCAVAVWLAIVLLVGSLSLRAQVTTGTILGTVMDASGAVVPNASVTVRNSETGGSRTVETDAAGRYRAPQLGLGNYEVTAEAGGFQTMVRSGITLTVGREAMVDFTLQVGAISERVTVTGEAPLIETSNATVAGLVDEKTLRDLPLNGRSFADLTAIQPGVISDLEVQTPGYNVIYSGGGSATRKSIGGTKPSQSSYLLDGIEISTPSHGTPVSSVIGQQLGVDAIREFTLLQSNYGAQFGRAAGGVVNAVTQSGTNSFHGSVFEFFRNDALDARDYFLRPQQGKAPVRRNQFGGSLGGPIRKDKTFFFANYEGLRQSGGAPHIGAVLTPETRQGRITNNQGVVTQTVPVSPEIVPIMNILPLPNGGFQNGGVADLFSVGMWRADENYGIIRVDQQISSKDNLFFRLTKDQSSRTDELETVTPTPWLGYQVGGYVLAAVSETRLITNTIINTARLGFTRRNDDLFYTYTQRGPRFENPDLDPRIAPVRGVPIGSYSIPGTLIYGHNTGVGPRLGGPALFVDNTFDFDDSLLINRGRHAITLGGNLKRYRMNTLNEPWVYGSFSWNVISDFLTNNAFSTTQLLGRSVPGSQLPDVYRGWRQTYGALFFQDDFNLRPGLTINLGVRWEKATGPKEVDGKLAVLRDIFRDRAFTRLTKEDEYFSIPDGLKGFSPRFGFAWTPTGGGKSVVRGGFGAFKEIPLLYTYQLALEVPEISERYLLNRPNIRFPFAFGDESVLARAGAGEPLMLPLEVKEPYTMQWTFSVEHQLGETWVAKANYLGTRGLNLFTIYNPNQHLTEIQGGRHFTPVGTITPNPNYTGFRYVAPISTQQYHGLQLVFEKRLASGLRFNTSYTWSKNIDTGGGAGLKGSENVEGTNFTVGNSYDRVGDKGLSVFHTAHNWISSFTYELPYGTGKAFGATAPAAVRYILGGWVVNGTASLRTGLPVTINGFTRRSRCVSQCGERPDLRPGADNNPVLENWTPERYFDFTQFVNQDPGFFGNVGRNTLIRPGVTNFNLSFAKDNPIGEGRNVEFRAEMFNFTNHPNFGAPNASIFRNAAGDFNPNVGRITTTSTSMRQIQFGIKVTF